MAAGPVGESWAFGSWDDTAWDASSWGEEGVPPVVVVYPQNYAGLLRHIRDLMDELVTAFENV